MSLNSSQSIISSLLSVLPTSPFLQYRNSFSTIDSTGLAWLNWFFPVSECLSVMSAWLVAVALFYVYSVVMRWVKLIGD